MTWPDNKLEPVERYLYEGTEVRIGKFDCHNDHDCFAVTESIADDMFVLATRSLWLRRRTKTFQYVNPGSVLLHTAGSTIERRKHSNAGDIAFWFAVKPRVFEEAVKSQGLSASISRLGFSATPEMLLKFASIFVELNQTQPRPFELESQALSLLDEVCEEAQRGNGSRGGCVVRTESRARARRLIDRTKAYIDQNLADDIDLGAIANEVGLSAFYLCRLFKSLCGVTIHEYRIRQRLAYVLEQLSVGDGKNLTRLALDSGFSSHSHLTRMFSRRFGMPPSSYRQFANGQGAVA